jgi:hypothetical protein
MLSGDPVAVRRFGGREGVGAAAHTLVLKYISASPNSVALDAFMIRP